MRIKHEAKAARSRLCMLLMAIALGSVLSILLFILSASKDAEHRDSRLGSGTTSSLKTLVHTSPTSGDSKVGVEKAHVLEPTNSLTRRPGGAVQVAGLSDEIKRRQLLNGNLHFVHIPKCGGTTMTAVLREIQCVRDTSLNKDCCLNPGFCDWHAHRRCGSIKGCINHFPNR